MNSNPIRRSDREVRLAMALVELTAMVRGECPSLLDDDSGGNARLALEIEALLDTASTATKEDA